MTIGDFLALSWSAPGPALIGPPPPSPVIADPSFLFPEETPDGVWELFAHSAFGIHRYSSQDGLSWRDRGTAVWHAMRPFARRHGASYDLYFERYRPFALAMTALPVRPRWRSEVAVSSSADLSSWSRPKTLIAPSTSWARDPELGDSASNPCVAGPLGDDGRPAGGQNSENLARSGGAAAWRLYYSASLSWIDDCGFCEPRYIAVAEGPSPTGPFSPRPAPIIDPALDPLPGVIGSGSIKVIAMDDGWIGLQNKIYADAGGKSRSAIFTLRSVDGLSWEPARSEPLLAPAPGWTSSHVYACDCRFREADGSWHLYFNARDGWRISEGVERIGKIVGRPV